MLEIKMFIGPEDETGDCSGDDYGMPWSDD